MTQEMKYLQDHIRLMDATIDELANLTRQAEATREELKARYDELCASKKPSALQIINEMRAELVSEGINPDDSYRDYATGNYGLA